MRRLKVAGSLVAAITAMLLMVPSAAHADVAALIELDNGICNISGSIGFRAVAANVYAARGTGSGNCPGSPDSVSVFIQEQDPATGEWVEVSSAEGFGSNGASASTEFICKPTRSYRTMVIAGSPGYARKKPTSSAVCPTQI